MARCVWTHRSALCNLRARAHVANGRSHEIGGVISVRWASPAMLLPQNALISWSSSIKERCGQIHFAMLRDCGLDDGGHGNTHDQICVESVCALMWTSRFRVKQGTPVQGVRPARQQYTALLGSRLSNVAWIWVDLDRCVEQSSTIYIKCTAASYWFCTSQTLFTDLWISTLFQCSTIHQCISENNNNYQ